MLSFSHPLFLLALPLALVPILIHLLFRKEVQVLRWSSLILLKEVIEERKRKFRIRNWFLLFIRCLIVILFILAFAGLQIGNSPQIITKAGTSAGATAIIIDNSLSMGYRYGGFSSLEKAVNFTRQFIEKCSSDHIIYLFLLCGADPVLIEGEPAAKLKGDDRLEQIKLTCGKPALILIADLIRRLEQNSGLDFQAIYLLTDLYKNTFDELLTDRISFNLPLLIVDTGVENPINHWIEIEHPINLKAVAGMDTTISALIKSNKIGEKIAISLYVDGKRKAFKSAELSSFSTRINFPISESGGAHFIRIALEKDQFPYDDDFLFGFGIPQDIKVLVVLSDDEKSFKYLKMALESSNYFELTLIKSSELKAFHLDNCDLVILIDGEKCYPLYKSLILSHLKKGGGAFFILGSNTGAILPKKLLSLEIKGEWGGKSEENSTIIGDYLYSHPILENLNQAVLKASDIFFYNGRKIFIDPSSRRVKSLIQLKNGFPLVLEEQYGEGRVIFLSSSLNGMENNLPFHKLYIPLIYRILFYLAGGDQETAFFTTDPIDITYQEKILISETDSGYELLDQSFLPAFYKSYKDKNFHWIGKNIPRDESPLIRMAPTDVSTIFPQGKIIKSGEIKTPFKPLSLKFSSPSALFIATLFLLIMEMVIANSVKFLR